MIRHPLGLRLDPARPIRDQIYEAARIGAQGVVLDAIGDLAPQRLGETGRRELRHLLRTVELSLVALSLPTRRPFDTIDQLDERIRRADAAFAMAYELGTNLVLARVGAVPPEEDRNDSGSSPRRWPRSASGPTTAASGWPSRPARSPGPAQGLPRLPEPGRAGGQHRPLQPCSVRGLTRWRPLAIFPAGSHTPTRRRDGQGGGRSAIPRGFGLRSRRARLGSYLGSLEEIGYSGFLTIWPDPAGRCTRTIPRRREASESALLIRQIAAGFGLGSTPAGFSVSLRRAS